MATFSCFCLASTVLLIAEMYSNIANPDVDNDPLERDALFGLDSASGKVITADVPLAEMFGYATDLRSATQGRATYTMEFKQYAEVPSNIADSIIDNTAS